MGALNVRCKNLALIMIGVIGLMLLLAGCSNPQLKQAADCSKASKTLEDKIKKDIEDKLKQLDSEFDQINRDLTNTLNRVIDAHNADQLASQADFDTARNLTAQMADKISQADQILARMEEDISKIEKERKESTDAATRAAKESTSEWFKQYAEKTEAINVKKAAYHRKHFDLALRNWQGNRLELQSRQGKLTELEKINGASRATRNAAIEEWNQLVAVLNPQVEANNADLDRLRNEIKNINKEIKRLTKERSEIIRTNWYRAILESKREVLMSNL